MIRAVTMALVAMTLPACASTDKVLSKAPKGEFYSESPAAEVAYCLANKNNSTPMPRADGGTLIAIKNTYGAVGTAFTVYPNGEGSRIVYHHQFGPFGVIWKQCVGRNAIDI